MWGHEARQRGTPPATTKAHGQVPSSNGRRVFAVASSRKSTRKLFRRSLELMVLKDHEFGQNPTFPPYAFHPWPFHAGISFCIGKRAMAMF